MRVILVRHAKADPGTPDELRPLTSAGRDDARMLGDLLAERQPNAVLTSPLLRARETADAIAAAAGLTAVVDERLAPGADLDALRAVVEGRGETVIVVGHQPDCGEIALALSGRELSFPTAGFAELDL